MHKIRPHQLAGMFLALSGLAVMTGWLTHQQRMHQLLADYLPVAFSATLCFFMAGLALLPPPSRPRTTKAAQLAATLVLAVLGGLSMLQHLSDADFGVDRLFTTPLLIDGLRPPARMSPLASLGFLLAAICFSVLRRLGTSRPVQLAVQVLSHVLLGLGIFGLVGYSLRLEVLYGWYRFARMAPYSAVCFIMLGAALWGLWYGTMKRSGVYTDREDKRIAAIATLILFVLAFTGGLTGFVLTTQRTEASLWQGMEAALANRTQLIETVIADRVQLSAALAADPAVVTALRAAGTQSPAVAVHKVPQRFLGPLVTGMVLLSADGKPLLAQGRLDARPRFSLTARSGVTLLWNGRTLLEVAAPVMEDGKRLGTLVTQHVLTPVDRLLADAGLPGQTGQLLVCGGASGGHIACLPSRLQPDGYLLASRINANDGKPWPAARALEGQSGIASVTDGRRHRVIAAFGPVRGLHLGVVVKQETLELYAPLRAQLTDLLVLLTLLVGSSLVLLRWQLLPLVTSLLQAKRAASFNEARIRSVVESVADGLLTLDELGRIESLNPAAAAMFGYAPDEVIGQHVNMLIPADLRQGHSRKMADYRQSGQPASVHTSGVESHGLRKDGSRFPIQVSIREMCFEHKRMFVGIVRDVSAQKHAEQEMRVAEERFRLVSQATNDVVWDLDFATEQTWWNEGILHQFGYPPSEVDPGPAWWSERLHPEDRDDLLARIDRQLDSGCLSWTEEYRFRKADGSYIHIEDRAYIIRDGAGRPTRAIGAMMDVTKRKLAKDLLRRSEERFSNVFNMSPVAITITRAADGRFLDANDALLQMLGYRRDEVVGNSSMAIGFWYTTEERTAMVERIQHHGSVRDFPMRGRTKDGAMLDLLISVDQLELNGESYLFCFLTNITDRKRAEEALRDSEERFRSIVETTEDWIWSIDVKGCLLYANPAVEDILGYPAEQLLGTSILHHLHEEQRAHVEASLSQVVTQKGRWSNLLMRWRHKDGSDRYTQSNAVPILDESGELIGYRGSDHDITLLKRYEQNLEEAKHKAEAANQAKSEFLANMSHEIRTPMNAVIGLTSLVLNTRLSGQQREYLELMKSSADSLLRLLNDILDFSKMEARKLELDPIEFDVREAVGNTLKTFAASAGERQIELTCHVAPTVPAVLVGDPGRLAQIIVNLTGNALKFTRQGEVVVRVAAEPQADNGTLGTLLHISVADSGIGMSEEQQATIFQAFQQADSSTTRQFGGTGLGLSIVSQLVALMDGSIRVDSALGTGTTFHVAVRLGVPERQPPAPGAQQPLALKGMPVLVVDDNRSNRLILAEILTSWGMRPALAAGGQQALEEMRQQAALGTPFPLVLLDADMPQVDGFDVAGAIRAAPELDSACVMMLSSSDVSAEIARCDALGVTGFVRKPVKQSELFDAIVTAANSAPRPAAGASEDDALLSAPPPRRLNVLVAEDHPVNQVLIAAILNGRGHAFSIANNGVEVLRLLERAPGGQPPFDVVLMDGQMPVMDGYQATREIRRRERGTGKHLRIIAVTANAMKDDRDRCLAAGMDDYVSKPIDADQLLERLESAAPAAGVDQAPAATAATAAAAAAPATLEAFALDAALKRARGKRTLLRQLVQLLLQDLPETLAALEAALAAGDARLVERTAHRLRGAAFTVCAEPLAAAAAGLELAARDADPARMQVEAGELQARATELTAELNAFMENDQ
jgi:PAS domain S-box-containing protein